MSDEIDLSQFHGVFIEESYEHLDTMERLLMALSIEAPDKEDLNSIFRAAHSIKGGSGIFGFDALTTVTHVMENIFDKARQNLFNFSASVIDDLLKAIDLLRTLLNDYAEAKDVDVSAVDKMAKQLESLISKDEKQDKQEQQDKQEHEEGFGFFEEQPSAPNSSQDDEAFGFFEENLVKPDNGANKESDTEDGFGFFELNDAAESLPTSTSTTTHIAPTPIAPTPKESVATKQDKKPPPQKSINQAKTESLESSSIRVDTTKVDSLVNLVGELVITQSMLNVIGAEIDAPQKERLMTALAELERNTRELQESIMSIRMLPLSFVFNRFPRVVRDLSLKLNKKVELVIEGGQTEIDKGLIEKLVDPLTHLVRNSLDHGIEMPEIRQAQGKLEEGILTLKAEQKGGNIVISVSDDGAGLNREKILQKAKDKGITLPANPTDFQIWQLIMAPGFSTAAEVTDVSGRGVGMDVVKRNIEAMSGRIEINSIAGAGSEFQIYLPLTLAILDGMSVVVADQLFIIPLVNIIESIQPSPDQLKNISNQKILDLRNTYWPIVSLHEVMDIEGAETQEQKAILILIETTKARFALMVDNIIGQQQVVIKSLEQHYRRVKGVGGATIMGDGSVALILDVDSLSTQVKETDF